jgi:O-antigen/teichoic acid export membrane protein
LFPKFIRNSLFAIFILFLAFIANLAVSILLSNLLGSQAFGDYKIAINILQFFSTLALVGGNSSVYKFLPEYVQQHAWPKARGFIDSHIKLSMKISAALFILAALFFAYLSLSSEQHIVAHRFYHPAIIMLIFILPWAILMLSSSIIRSLGNNEFGLLPFFIVPSLVFMMIYLVSLWVLHIQLEHALFLFGIAIFVVMIFECWIAYRLLPKQILAQSKVPTDKAWWDVSSKLFVANIAFVGMELVELIALKLLMPDSTYVGIYSAILVIASLIFLIRQALNLVISPLISPLIAQVKLKKLEKIINKANVLMLIFTTSIGLVLAYYASEILLLFGSEYIDADLPLYIVLFATALGSSCSLSVELLMFSNHHVDVLKINLSALIVTTILCFVLIPIYGLIGAAIAFLCSRILLVGLSIGRCKKLLGIKSCFVF